MRPFIIEALRNGGCSAVLASKSQSGRAGRLWPARPLICRSRTSVSTDSHAGDLHARPYWSATATAAGSAAGRGDWKYITLSNWQRGARPSPWRISVPYVVAVTSINTGATNGRAVQYQRINANGKH